MMASYLAIGDGDSSAIVVRYSSFMSSFAVLMANIWSEPFGNEEFIYEIEYAAMPCMANEWHQLPITASKFDTFHEIVIDTSSAERICRLKTGNCGNRGACGGNSMIVWVNWAAVRISRERVKFSGYGLPLIMLGIAETWRHNIYPSAFTLFVYSIIIYLWLIHREKQKSKAVIVWLVRLQIGDWWLHFYAFVWADIPNSSFGQQQHITSTKYEIEIQQNCERKRKQKNISLRAN